VGVSGLQLKSFKFLLYLDFSTFEANISCIFHVSMLILFDSQYDTKFFLLFTQLHFKNFVYITM
jgi:hypothetical protein